MEHEADRMERESDRIGDNIGEARRDWETKEQDPAVPGAQADERQESDQLPEEGPPEQVPDDAGGEVREEAEDSPGTPGDEGTATGNPDAAGSDE